jgi:hypothetical protein
MEVELTALNKSASCADPLEIRKPWSKFAQASRQRKRSAVIDSPESRIYAAMLLGGDGRGLQSFIQHASQLTHLCVDRGAGHHRNARQTALPLGVRNNAMSLKHRDRILNPRFGALGCCRSGSGCRLSADYFTDFGSWGSFCRLLSGFSPRPGTGPACMLDRERTSSAGRVDHSHAIRLSPDLEQCHLALDLADATRSMGGMGKTGSQGNGIADTFWLDHPTHR